VWKSCVIKDYAKGEHHLSVWSVSWSLTGNVLAISASGVAETDTVVELFKEAADNVWETIAA